jgi:hypothetical protein
MTTTPRRVLLWRVFLLLVLVVHILLTPLDLWLLLAGYQPQWHALLLQQGLVDVLLGLVLLAGLAPRTAGFWLCALGEWLITHTSVEEN